MRQILINLLGNAVKFTETGSVRLVTRLVGPPEADGVPMLRFDVIDTGIGMSPAQLDKLFLPFHQADTSTTRRFGGTGLGLAISRRLAEALGGSIEVESLLGQGSTFRVMIPTGPPADTRMVKGVSAARTAPEPLRSPTAAERVRLLRRALLVEDGPDNQRLISTLLRKAGAEVTVAADGREGADRALAARAAGSPFDVILMDMQMPMMDGYAATRFLRERGYSGPILAVTAHAMTSDRQKCLDAGCDGFITKPLDARTLVETILSHLSTDEGLAGTAPCTSAT